MNKGKEKSGLPAVAFEVIGEMKVDKDDLIAVAVSREETRLLTDQADVDSQIRRLNKESKDAEKAVTKIREALVDGATSKDIKALGKALKDAGFSSMEVKATTGQDKDGKIEYSISVQRDRYNHLSTPGTVKISAEMKKLQTENEKRAEQAKDLQVEAVEIRKRISQLSSLERRAKANIAEQLLSKTVQGRAFLKSVEGVKSLPMPKE